MLLTWLAVWCLALPATTAAAPGSTAFHDAARGPVPILDSIRPPRLTNAVNDDQRKTRSHDMQPPVIPHRIDGYQVDRNFNKCLDCHARTRTEFSHAVPVSATHYVTRSGQVLGQISTRRYFCPQCHVAQEPVAPLVGNRFEEAGTVPLKAASPAARP
jgi:cytochrome c-type protein NapB